ncbi:hypothetical protein ACXC9Q_06360 [Kribbella sp. CWNU-51]
MTGAAAVADTIGIPPLGRDRRVHAWILSGAISEAGDVAWYVGLAWSAAQVAPPAGTFQQTIEPAFLGRTSSVVSLSDEGLMPIAMTGFGALISLTDVAVACALLGTAFAALMVWSASRLRG